MRQSKCNRLHFQCAAGISIESQNYQIDRMKLNFSTSAGVNEINKLFKYAIVLRQINFNLVLGWHIFGGPRPFPFPNWDFLLNYEMDFTIEQEELNADSYRCRFSSHSTIFIIQ